MSDTFPNYDFDQEFSITLSWNEWLRVLHLVEAGVKWKGHDGVGLDWSGTDEVEEDEVVVESLKSEYFDTRPGNGIDDWPDSMKAAYDESVSKAIEEMEYE